MRIKVISRDNHGNKAIETVSVVNETPEEYVKAKKIRLENATGRLWTVTYTNANES